MVGAENTLTIENIIYVGVDGSQASIEAARWAASEARLRRTALCLVHGHTSPMAGAAGSVVYPSEMFDADRDWLRAMLSRVREGLLAEFPELDVRLLVRYERPVTLLADVSSQALMTVVGSHGSHRFTEFLIGSVALFASIHAAGPIVVVRVDPASGSVRRTGPVVVGLDGLADSEDALAFALAEASLRGTRLVAVHSWDDAHLKRFERAVPLAVDRTAIDDEERRLLAVQLAGWADKYPDVVVEPTILRGSASSSLLRSCTDGTRELPALLVLGSRGRGGIAGMLLGSTSQQVIARAPCPVVVVRSQQRG